MANIVEISQRGQVVAGMNPVTGKLTMLKTDDDGALQIVLSGASINVDLNGSAIAGDSVHLYAYDGTANQRVACTAGGVLKVEEVANVPLTPDVDGVTVYGTSTGADNVKLKLDADGHQQIDILSDQPITPAVDGIKVFGTDGTENVQVKVDADGHVKTDVLTMPGDRAVLYVNSQSIAAAGNMGSSSVNVLAYGTVSILVNAVAASATNGLVVQAGNNAADMYTIASYSIAAGDTKAVVLDIPGQWLKVTYTQGAAAGNVDLGVYGNK